MSLINCSFLGILLELQDFMVSSAPYPGKIPPKAEIFMFGEELSVTSQNSRLVTEILYSVVGKATISS
jgi:hypothetical protein